MNKSKSSLSMEVLGYSHIMRVKINNSPRKQEGSVPSMAAKVEGVEGPISPPQGVDGGWSRTRHPWVEESVYAWKGDTGQHHYSYC